MLTRSPMQLLLLVALAAGGLRGVVAEMYCGDENCYTLLGLERAADFADIKKAFRSLSMTLHPDSPDMPEESTAMFQKIAAAYEVLSDEQLRDAYNYYLDHPDEAFTNKMKYYRAVYKPQTPVWAVIIVLLLMICIGQIFHFGERKKTFMNSPQFRKELEEEYVANCTRGRHGYQTGELNEAKKKKIRKGFEDRLSEIEGCPLALNWSHTLIPLLVYRWPQRLARWAAWRVSNSSELAEERRAAEAEAREEAEKERREEEEAERQAAEKERMKKIKAQHLEERLRKEEEQKQKWAEEALREAAAEAERDQVATTVSCKVTSVTALKKKGHHLVEVNCNGDELQLVVEPDAPVPRVGQLVTVALEGAKLDSGVVKRRKVGGEWSEGVLLELGSVEEAASPEVEPLEPLDAEVEVEAESTMPEVSSSADTRQRKKGKAKA
mmetsp:Transcript_64052/g.139306  ORF Transcript_64052/g.139306 Transcript_64052/m.139306 type:complete len:438 (-) Transcript_64052:31-1344(-)